MKLASLLSLALLACGDGGPSGPPGVTLGTGDLAFEALTSGGQIYVIQGPQGGHHLLGSIRARGIEPGDPEDLQNPFNPTIEFRVFAGTERVDAMASRYVQGLDDAGDEYEMLGRLVILDIVNDDELDNVSIRFEVELTDTDGIVVSDARDLIAIPHPANQQ